ncbi:hypothetical protein [Engelhardtia mirabilis]|uniref:Autotransporter-associated beta strand repeat protein n=1 Tax=Engelhardtia mirabilis TaxID=2528011 RepID=A0A518BRD5_9BACT|nr:hypothetical protein Pla133_46460 [Planctomycetes bacterium Pla133]QDV03852.1 hypothetical protein Pla86_46440 [Planctomycetes bacterium Pla86]
MQPIDRLRALGAFTFLCVLGTLAPAAQAQSTLTWIGGADGDWNNATNWTGGSVPGPSDTAIIPTGTANAPQAVFGDVVVGSVQINAGAVVGIQDTRTLTVNAHLTCNGAIDAYGSGALVVGGNLSVSVATASFNGLSEVSLIGPGTVSANASVLLPPLSVVGGLRVLYSGRSAGLHLDQGASLPTVELRVIDGGLFTVDGDALLSAPITSQNVGSSTRTLVINGTTTWDVPNYPPGSEKNAAFVLRANGDWQASTSTALEAGWVELGGAGTHVIRSAFGSTFLAVFLNLRIIDGTRLLENKNVRVLGECEVRSATFDLDWPEYLEIEGTLDTNWAGASLVNKNLGATVPVRLTGNGELRGGVNPLPELEILGGVHNCFGLTAESLTLSGGASELVLRDGTTTHVLGPFQHNDGVLRFDAVGSSARVLRVDGLFQQFGGTLVSPSGADRIEVLDDWVSQNGYFMDNGWVEFEAPGQLSGSSPQIKRMRLVSGAREIVDDLEVFGELTSIGGSTTGSGWIEMTGTITPISTGANLLNRVRVVGGVVNITTSHLGTLEVVGGNLRLLDGVGVTIDGDLRFLGGLFASQGIGSSLRYLDVGGDMLEAGTAADAEQNAATRIRVAGDWVGVGAFVLPTGWVELDGGGASTIGGAAPTFGNLRLAGGAHTLLAATRIDQELEVRSSLDLGAQDLTVQGNLDSNWSGATIVGTGPIVLDGDGELRTNGNSIPPLHLIGGTRQVFPSFVEALHVSGGIWRMRDGSPCTVAGDVLLDGGLVVSEPVGSSARGLTVLGDFTQSSTMIDSTVSATTIRVAGNWSSDPSFVLEQGWVYLDGGDSEIGGAGPTFKRLRLVSGINTLTSEVEVNGELISQGGSTAGSPWLNMTDAVSAVSTGANEIARLRVAAGTIPITTSRVGDLEIAGGQLRLLDGVALTVSGDATFLAGQFASQGVGSSLRYIDVAGTFVESGTIAAAEQNAATEIRVAGDFTGNGDFTLPLGWFELDGAANQVVDGTGPVFGNLRVENGTATLATDVLVEQELEVRGSLDLADRDLEVVGTLDSNWSGATIVGVGPLRLTGNGDLRTTGNYVAPIRVEDGLRQVFPCYLQALELSGGIWRSMDGSTCFVAGDALLTGGILDSQGVGSSARGIDVEGSLVHTGTTVDVQNSATTIKVAGDWSSDFLFTMDEGWVQLDGGDAELGGPNPIFKRLRLVSGVKTLTSQVEVFGSLLVQGGSTQGEEFIVMPGAITPVQTGANLVNKLRVTGGSVPFTTSHFGELQMTGGQMEVLDGVALTVDGDVTFSGGVFSTQSVGSSIRLLDVGGNFSTTAATLGFQSVATRLRVAGDWSSNSAFQMTSGIVELDGTGTSYLRGSVPGLDPMLPTVQIKNGTRLVDDSVDVTAASVTIDAGARLEAAAGGDLRAAGVPFVVNGTLAASAGGRLSLGALASVLVNGGGRLELLGEPGDPATLGGVAGGGYAVTVNGTLAARDFVVSQPGPDGLVMNGSYAAAPDDLRGGEFASPAATGSSTLLTLGHAAAKTLYFVRFEDSALTGTYNVRRTTGGDVAFQNFGGDFSGEAFEDDPGDRIDWLPPAATEIVFFKATNGPQKVFLNFETSFEADVQAFILEAGPAASGPFATVVELAPTGVGSYAAVDAPLAADTEVFYRLLERRTDGFVRLLGEDAALPYSAATPANVRTVGPTGEFATIQAAIDAATSPFTVISVAPGTYPSFSIVSPTVLSLSILPEAPGVVIDASAAPVAIHGVGFGKDVILADLVIDGGATDSAVDLASNFGAVVLDRCDVNGGTGQPGLESFLSLAVSLQDCDLAGSPGLLSTASATYSGRGSIDELQLFGGSRARLCGLTPSALSGDGSETVTSYPGVSPQLTLPRYQSLGEPFSADLEAAPGTFHQLAASATALPLDLDDPGFWQMLLLVNAGAYFEVGEGFTDGAGQASTALTLPPEGGLLGARLLLQAWTIQVVPTVEVRFSGVQPLVAMP